MTDESDEVKKPPESLKHLAIPFKRASYDYVYEYGDLPNGSSPYRLVGSYIHEPLFERYEYFPVRPKLEDITIDPEVMEKLKRIAAKHRYPPPPSE